MDSLDFLIGSDPQTITWWQMCIRATIIFFYLLFLVRFGSIRAFGRSTSFDIVLAILLGSTISRALTGNSKLIPTLAASAVLVFLHRALAVWAFYSEKIGHLVKGKEIPLAKGGSFDRKAMKKASITRHDILEALRTSKGKTDSDIVKDAYLERSGKISLIDQ